MKFLALLRKEKNKKRRDITSRQEDLLSRQGREQFEKLNGWGLRVSISI